LFDSEVKLLEGESYEGAEALLMACSNEFTKLWHERLMDKLFALGGTIDSDSDHDDEDDNNHETQENNELKEEKAIADENIEQGSAVKAGAQTK